jgi:hypothetical protein
VADRIPRPGRALLIVVGLLAALLAASFIAACGGSAAASDPLAGYWLGGDNAKPILVHVVKDGEKYSVAVNPDMPLSVTKHGDSLVADTHAVDMTFAPGADNTLTVTVGGQAVKKERVLTLKRVDETQYADAAVKYGVNAIRSGLKMWLGGGAKTLPPANEVSPSGALSEMVVPWPTNMFSGQPMQPGENKGNYTYTVSADGKQYELVGHLSDGSTTTGQ